MTRCCPASCTINLLSSKSTSNRSSGASALSFSRTHSKLFCYLSPALKTLVDWSIWFE